MADKLSNSLSDAITNLNYLKKSVQSFSMQFTLSVAIPRATWICGLLICNTNGGGNGVYYIDVTTTGTFTCTKIASNQGNNATITGSASGNVLTLNCNLNGNSLRFDNATWIGLYW